MSELETVHSYCDSCDFYYRGGDDVPCPLCPLDAARKNADERVLDTEPYRVLSFGNYYNFQRRLNEMTGEGWTLMRFTVGQTLTNEDGFADGRPEYIALMGRDGYDLNAHVAALAAQKKAKSDYREKLLELDRADVSS